MADRGISPRVSNSVDLGSASKAWRKVYAGRIDEGTYIPGAFNKKETFTTSGTFTAPVTGVYRITLQGGGGGGGGAGTHSSGTSFSGGGGGQGGHIEFYEKLTFGTSYTYTVGAGGAGGAKGSGTAGGTGSEGTQGGSTTIIIGNKTYFTEGGVYGKAADYYGAAGRGGRCYIYVGGAVDYTFVGRGAPGVQGVIGPMARGGSGGGMGGGEASGNLAGVAGGGGSGGAFLSSSNISDGGSGGNGYVEIEYYDPNA